MLRCPTTDEWIKKIWYIYTMEYYSAIKKNEIMLLAGKWIELKHSMPGSKGQRLHVFPHM
jgi:hypothetical protein